MSGGYIIRRLLYYNTLRISILMMMTIILVGNTTTSGERTISTDTEIAQECRWLYLRVRCDNDDGDDGCAVLQNNK